MIRTCIRGMSGWGVCLALTAVLCGGFGTAARGEPTPFTSEAIQRGIIYWMGQASVEQSGFGVAFVDLNLDGYPDLVALGAANGLVGVWENDGTGYFIERSAGTGIPLLSNTSGIAAADYDGDGLPDLLITRWFAETHLFRNKGNFTFEDVTVQAGITNAKRGESAHWGDYDGDGWLDLYITNYCGGPGLYLEAHNIMLRNKGDGTFEDVSAALGLNDNGCGLHAVFGDYDRDGDMDIYLSNDRGHLAQKKGNRLWENAGGTFVDVSKESGTDGQFWSMGVAFGDFDDNGHNDFYCTNLGAPSRMYFAQGDKTFIEDAVGSGMGNYGAGWAAHFFDFDNDHDLDLYVVNCCGTIGGNRLYVNYGTLPVFNEAAAYNVALNNDGLTLAVADIDGDGDLDFLVGATTSPLTLMINHEGQKRKWMRVRVVDGPPNRHAIGAMVDAKTQYGWQHRQVLAGSNYKSQDEYIVHFGLNDAAVVEQLKVTWPDGFVRTFEQVPVNRLYAVTRTGPLVLPAGEPTPKGDEFQQMSVIQAPELPPQPDLPPRDDDLPTPDDDGGIKDIDEPPVPDGPLPRAIFGVSPSALDFGIDLDQLYIVVSNAGGQTSGYVVVASEPWISINPETVDMLTPGVSVIHKVTINRALMSKAGLYSATLTFVPNKVDVPIVTVPVTAIVTANTPTGPIGDANADEPDEDSAPNGETPEDHVPPVVVDGAVEVEDGSGSEPGDAAENTHADSPSNPAEAEPPPVAAQEPVAIDEPGVTALAPPQTAGSGEISASQSVSGDAGDGGSKPRRRGLCGIFGSGSVLLMLLALAGMRSRNRCRR